MTVLFSMWLCLRREQILLAPCKFASFHLASHCMWLELVKTFLAMFLLGNAGSIDWMNSGKPYPKLKTYSKPTSYVWEVRNELPEDKKPWYEQHFCFLHAQTCDVLAPKLLKSDSFLMVDWRRNLGNLRIIWGKCCFELITQIVFPLNWVFVWWRMSVGSHWSQGNNSLWIQLPLDQLRVQSTGSYLSCQKFQFLSHKWQEIKQDLKTAKEL